MSRLARLSLAALTVLLPVTLAATARAAAADSAPDSMPVAVTLDPLTADAGPGEKISIESRVENTGGRPLTGLVAHLSILSTDPGVFVDPEDWSPERTQYLDRLGPGESATLTWSVQAVTSGPIQIFVSVTDPGGAGVVSGGPVNLTVGGHRVVNAGGVLPLVLVMPAGMLTAFGATLLRRRRHR